MSDIWEWEVQLLMTGRSPSIPQIAAKLWALQEARTSHMPMILKRYLADNYQLFEAAVARGPLQARKEDRHATENHTSEDPRNSS